MKMRRMKVNRRQLQSLSRGASADVQREGRLQVGRQHAALTAKFCRLRGNLLFILNEQGGKLEEVLLLERCKVMKLQNDDKKLAVCFEGGDPPLFLCSSSAADGSSWLAALTGANMAALRRRVEQLQQLISSQRHGAALQDGLEEEEEEEDEEGDKPAGGSQLRLTIEVRGLVTTATRLQVQVSASGMNTQEVTAEMLDEGVFVSLVRFPGDDCLNLHSKIKVLVSHHAEEAPPPRSFLGFTSFSIRELLASKEPHVSLTLRTMDAAAEVGELTVSHLQMEGDGEQQSPGHECPALCDSLHSSVHDAENSPMMRAALRAPVSRLYRFQTEDRRWLLVREQMAETPLSFSLPRQLLSALVQEHADRVQEVAALGELSPHWDGLRHDVTAHCSAMMDGYRETLAALEQLSASSCFKSSSSKSERQLQFVPTNLHSQRMEVTAPQRPGVWYEVITFGAPADHHQGFKHGGLKRLLSKHLNARDSSISYSREESSRARELLASVARLQPLLFGLAEELLAVSAETDAGRLRDVLDALTQQTERFVHALKDELVRSALLEIHSLTHRSHAHCNGLQCEPAHQQGAPQDEYDEEEWDRAWANVAKSLNCIVVMVDRLQAQEPRPQEVTSPPPQEAAEDTHSASSSSSSSSSSWQEQLLPLVVTLRDCVREATGKAQSAMSFVVLQGAAAATLAQGPAHILRRRHAVFSQTLAAVACGFLLKLCGALQDQDFLQQLHQVGLLLQFEGLLSTYGDELGMLEDMEVGVADLSSVAFAIAEAETEEPDDLLPTLRGTWGSLVVEVPLPPETFSSLPPELRDGRLIRVEAVLFNIGINQQQSLAERFGDSSLQERVNQQSCERLRSYCHLLAERRPDAAGVRALPELLSSLERSLEARKRKNVEVLWTAATVCRAVNGVRLTSCKSAKDRTAMSVTLEQCALLRERHLLGRQHFSTALDCMRRDGCRLDNVQKNVGNRKFAFSGVQLLTFPKLYRPPDGSYG